MIPVKNKMKEEYYNRDSIELGWVNISNICLQRLNGLPIEIDNTIDGDYEIVYEPIIVRR